MTRLINLSTSEGDTVLDPFTRLCTCGMGGGSTGVAAIQSGRKFTRLCAVA